ncbi:amino acid adenylation domain-containing protein [Paenibacillus pabuli]|uniref:amino acid adenylation domain-containing protein n=1 Tax=Paenibacillus pabuli TaxID=1472 RepID=UPI003CEC2890
MRHIEKYILSQVSQKRLTKQEAKVMIQELKKNSAVGQAVMEDKFAIVGLSCNLPGARNVEEFWTRLCDGENMVGQFPRSRREDIERIVPDTDFRVGGYLEDIAYFDPAFFRISAKEAELMDPNQRLFLQSAWEALEDAGLSNAQNSSIGVFVGMESTNYPEYARFISEDNPLIQTGASTGILASRISYILNLHGPTMVIDCACSSSLVALHTAGQYIRNGECEAAIVGGVSLFISPNGRGMVDSIHGQIRAFDGDADGTVWGEGIASVVIMPLEAALKKRHSIYAVIKGSAVNNDGASNGITAPSAEAQARLLSQAWGAAGVSPESLTYIEAHGTGTKLGDPIEIKGITQAIRKHTQKPQFCAIGSVKTNIGHSNGAAGIISVIKMALCFKYGKLPPSLFFQNPNPFIDFMNSPIYVNDKLQEWNKKDDISRMCGISSFGFSGTNCHVVLEEPPSLIQNDDVMSSNMFVLSAKSEQSLRETVARYVNYLENEPCANISDICFTASVGRMHFPYRLAFLVRSTEELIKALSAYLTNVNQFLMLEGAFYGYHKIVHHRENAEDGGITDEDKAVLTEEARRILLEAGDQLHSSQILSEFCNLYTRGADMDWKEFFKNTHLKLLNLPAYAFERWKCWVSDESVRVGRLSAARERNTFLPGTLLAKTMGYWIYEAAFSADSHWLMKEHKIVGQYVLPGTAYLEMAVQVGARCMQREVTELFNVQIHSPLVVGEQETKIVHTSVKQEKEKYIFQIASFVENSDNEWVIHATGELGAHPFSLQDLPMEKRFIDIDLSDINLSCKPPMNEMIEFGPRWNNIIQVDRGTNESSAILRLPAEFSDDLNAFRLHPAMMDMAVSDFFSKEGSFLPLFYKKVVINGALPSQCISNVVRVEGGSEEIRKYNIMVTDVVGNIVVCIEGYATKRVQAKLHAETKGPSKEHNLFQIKWRKEEKQKPVTAVSRSRMLIVKGKAELSESLTDYLRKQGNPVLTAVQGDSFEMRSENDFVISANQEDYDRLVQQLKDNPIERIVYMAAIDGEHETSSIQELRYRQEVGYTGLYRLTKSLVNVGLRTPMEIVIISDYTNRVTGEEPILKPDYATLAGLGRALGQEHPHIRFRHIDVDNMISVNQLSAELSYAETPYATAYREGNRYVECFDLLKKKEELVQDLPKHTSGFYLITGGYGGIGLELASYLASSSKISVVLLGRTQFPDEKDWEAIIHENLDEELICKIRRIRAIQESGIVHGSRADVSDYDQMKEALTNLKCKYGPLRGVVHAAGIAGDGFAVRRSEHEYHSSLHSKVYGTWILNELTSADDLDFFVACSSVSSLVGVAGQGDYSAANAYLDAFTEYRNQKGKHTLCINWASWLEAGMAKKFGGSKDGLFWPLSNVQGVALFEELLNSKIQKAIAGSLKLEESSVWRSAPHINLSDDLLHFVKLTERNPYGVMEIKESLELFIEGKSTNDYSDTEKVVAGTWAKALGTSRINIYDSFYDLGGDSIVALRIVNDINIALGLKIDIVDLFEHVTIQGLSSFLDTMSEIVPVCDDTSSEKYDAVSSQELFELSLAQKRIWFLQKFDEDMAAYNLFTNIPLSSQISLDLLNEALNIVTRRHYSLRTKFIEIDGEPWQYVSDEVVHAQWIDLSEKADPEAELLTVLKTEREKKVDLFGNLLRVLLVKIDLEKYHLHFNAHHLITDGWSSSIFFDELLSVYQSLENREPLDLPEVQYQYSDWINDQSSWLQSSECIRAESYWLSELKEPLPVLDLPADFTRPPVKTYNGDYLIYRFDGMRSFQFKELAKKTDVTPYMLMLSMYSLFLNKLTGNEDIMIGCPIAGRDSHQSENVIGLIMNMVNIRVNFEELSTCRELLAHVKQKSLQAYKFGKYPFDLLVSRVNPERDLSRSPIFSTMFQYYDHIPQPNPGYSQFDLSLLCRDLESEIELRLEFNTDLFRKESADAFFGILLKLIDEVINNSNAALNDLNYLPESQIKKLRYEFNDTNVDLEQNLTIHELFKRQALQTPHQIAVVCGNKSATYEELDRMSDGLAVYLQQQGVKSGDLIAIILERSINNIVAMLGILKSGAAYLPIDPAFPMGRIQYILEDSKAEFLITETKFAGSWNSAGVVTWDINELELTHMNPKLHPANQVSTTDMAYVIYTSGSTGKPKGVVIEHRSALNFIRGMTDVIEFSPGKTILAVTTVSFDICFLELILPLMRGMRIVIADELQQIDPEYLAEVIKDHDVEMIQMTPSRIQLLLQSGHSACLENMKEILIGGEAFKESLLHTLKNITPAKIYNMYGPTETTIWSTVKDLTNCSSVNIGKPISNTTIYILSETNKLVPIGGVGELCIGGTGLARGYLNKPELTSERFIEHPFETGERIYKTGDLAKWLEDGNIQHLGRNDHQIKVRGYRIEIGEVESVLLTHPVIQEAAIVAYQDHVGHSYLCAYYSSESKISSSVLYEHLALTLPDYMIPSRFTHLDHLPQTPNGKIDRKALIDMKPEAKKEDNRNPVERYSRVESEITEIWGSILDKRHIHLDDNFFEQGGHSLIAGTVVSRINKQLEVKLSLSELFQAPTIRKLSRIVEGKRKEKYKYFSIPSSEEQAYYPLTSAQKRLFVLHHLDKNSILYNIPAAYKVHGPLEMKTLKYAIQQVVMRHSALRTYFQSIEGKIAQVIDPTGNLEIQMNEAEEDELSVIANEWTMPFDIYKPLLFRVNIIVTGTNECSILMDMHHLVSDGLSIAIIMDEIIQIYKGRSIPEPKAQYRDFALWQRNWFQTESFRKQEAFWLNVFRTSVPQLMLPLDLERPKLQSFEGRILHFQVNSETTARIKKLAMSQESTLFMLLFAVYNLMLYEYTHQGEIVVGTPVSGRTHLDLREAVGVFMNMLPLRNTIDPHSSLSEFLQTVKDNTLAAFDNQDYPFEMLVEKLNLKRDLSRNPLFETVFSLQNKSQSEYVVDNLIIAPYEIETKISKFDLSLQVTEVDKHLNLQFEYCTNLFQKETIEKMAGNYIRLLNLAEEYINAPVEALVGSGIRLDDQRILRKPELLLSGSKAENDLPEIRLIEETIKDIWKKLLDLESLGVDENLFHTGAESFLIVQLQLELDQRYPSILNAADIFAMPTIAQIARFIYEKTNEQPVEIERGRNLKERKRTEIELSGLDQYVMEQLATRFELSLEELMAAIFCYVYAEITGQERIEIFGKFPGDGAILLDVDLESILNYEDLFAHIHSVYNSEQKEVYQSMDIDSNELGHVPCFTTESGIEIDYHFDEIFGFFVEQDSIRIIYDCVDKRSKLDEPEKLFYAFSNILTVLIQEHVPSQNLNG